MINNDVELVVINQKVLYQNGNFRHVRRYLKGMHPERGIIVKGLTGWETIEEVDVLIHIHPFQVAEK